MKRLLVILVVLASIIAGLAWADVRIRRYAEDEARSRLAEAIPQAERSEVALTGFPFVGRILVDGSVQRLSVTLHGLREGDLEVERLQLVADDIVLDRARLLEEHVLAVTDVGRVRVEARIAAAVIARAAGVPVELRDGTARVTVEGRRLEASISIAGPTVMLAVAGAPPLVVPLPEAYLPCHPELTIAEDHLIVACSTTELPDAIMEVLGEGTG
jgi:hypothetical protein